VGDGIPIIISMTGGREVMERTHNRNRAEAITVTSGHPPGMLIVAFDR